MGSCASQGCERRLSPVLCAGHGRPYQAQIPVSHLSVVEFTILLSTCLSSQPGQTSAADVAKRDLRAELMAAEQEAREKKRKAEGKPPLAVENGNPTSAGQDEETNKRRKLLQEALELDKDEDEDASETSEKEGEDNDDEEEYVCSHN